ncbi:hypothetical protein HPB52_024254 [Rhipicephalus sanguineus]|uniref:MYND-type domain-containing protein n=1 Tax=Rhipicephalus sanguineus TaxID=34632 RepID=A0A9D4TCM5_RHISA|nr:hypothetical protein HPB52_024254 [Rhipicephalus sanguineus]
MSTLESKIVELKKQIHHLTILATYKEKELACISSLRTAKEDALKQLESKYPGICSVISAFGTESGSGESSDSPGFTDVPSIVAQAATATADLTSRGVSLPTETDSHLLKKPAVQSQQQTQHSPALPIPLLAGTPAPHRLRANSASERDSPGRGLMPYDRNGAASGGLFGVYGALLSLTSWRRQRPPRPVPSAAVSQRANAFCDSECRCSGCSTPTSRGLSSMVSPSAAAAAAAVSSWWNAPNARALREYASSSSTAALLKAASVPSSLTKSHSSAAGSISSLSSQRYVKNRSHRRLAEAAAASRPEDTRDVAAELADKQEEFNLALGMYNQAMAYSLYQQLRAQGGRASAGRGANMQAGLPTELLSLQPKLSAPEMSWLQAGLVCVNCGDPRVKFVCSCCRTQTFCSEQCQAKLWSKLKTQPSSKN